MFRVAFVIALVSILCSFVACKKETFEPLVDHSVILADPAAGHLTITSRPTEGQPVIWKRASADALAVDGIVTIEFEKTRQEFLRVACPGDAECPEQKAFVPLGAVCRMEQDASDRVDLAGDPDPCNITDRPLLLVSNGSRENMARLQSWSVDAQDRELPDFSDAYVERFLANYLEQLEPAERERRIAEWYYLTVSFSQKLRNDAFRPYLKKYPVYEKIIAVAKGKSPEEAGLSEDQVAFLKLLGEFTGPRFDFAADERRRDFPFEAQDYFELADFFNKKITLPLFRELIFKKIVDDAPYKVMRIGEPAAEGDTAPAKKNGEVNESNENSAAKTAKPEPPPILRVKKVLFDLEFGAVVTYEKPGGGTLEHIFPELAAQGHANGLRFVLTSDEGRQIALEPLQKSNFLESGNAKYIDEFKGMDLKKELMALPNYKKRLMAFAVKFGEGDYVPEDRVYRYRIDTADKKEYWKVLRLLKSSPLIGPVGDDDYSGTIGDQDKYRWFQKYDKNGGHASLHLGGEKTMCSCADGCEGWPVKAVCADNTDATKMYIQFPGRSLTGDHLHMVELKLEHPDMDRHRDDCERVFGGEDLMY